MEQIGIAGIPSLWMSNQELLKQGYLIKDTLKLLEKYHKMFSVLRAHKKWENEKMFGKNAHALIQAGQAPVEFQFFRNNKLVSKFNENEQTLAQNEQEAQQLPLTRQYVRSFFPPGTQGTSQSNYTDSDNATYKMINSDKLIIKQVLETNNVLPASQDSQGQSLLWSCNALVNKQQIYESLTDYQKVNHFLNSTELTRKDRLYSNYMKMREKFGPSEYNYLPETFILPEQSQAFKDAFNDNQQRLKFLESQLANNQANSNFQKNHNDEQLRYQDNVWIVKPAQSSRGRGIYLLSDLRDIPKEEGEFVVCKYISNPLLISDHKFDLRIYVLITSVDPLKVYVFNEGLVRFASEPYNHDYIKNGKFSHLTNYSINKKSENFVQNKTAQERDVGNKWSMSALQQHLTKLGINVKPVWARIYDMIIKSLISVESQMMCNTKKQNPNSSKPSNCFELLGYDILLDSDLNPWILEVNLAPSLTADSPLDFHIKSNLVVDFFNLAGIRRPLKRNGKLNQRQVKQKSNSVAHNAQMTAQHAQTQYKGFVQENQSIQNSNSKDQMSSQSNLMKATVNPSVVGRNNMRKGNGTLSQGLGNGNTFISYFDYGMSIGNARKTLIGGGQQTAVPVYEGVEVSILEKISKVSAKHRALLFETLWEFERNTRLNFTRIFPSPGCSYYDPFFETIRPNNKLIYKYLCQRTELWAIIEQSAFNDLEPLRDLPKEMTVIEGSFDNSSKKDQRPENNFSIQDQEDPQGKQNLDMSVIVKHEDIEQTGVLAQIKLLTSPGKKEIDSEKGSFMERRKSMSRKQTGRAVKETEEILMPPLTNAQQRHEHEDEKVKRDWKVVNFETKMPISLIEDSVYEHSQNEEEEEKNQDSQIKLINVSQTHDSSLVGKRIGKQSGIMESQSNNTLKQKIKGQTQGMQQSIPCSKEKKLDSTFSSVVSQQQHPIVTTKMQIQVNTRISTGEQSQKPTIKDGKLIFDKTEPDFSIIRQERDFTNISSPRTSFLYKSSTKEGQALATIRTSKSPMRLDSQKIQESSKEKIQSNDYRDSSKNNLQNLEPNQNSAHKDRQSSSITNQEVKVPREKKKKEKVVITGDDILIEYVRRIKNALQKYPIKDQPNNVIYYLEKFLYHKVWSLNDQNTSVDRMKDFKNADIRRKLKIRYIEMKSRRESVKAMDKTIEQKAQLNKETSQQYIDRMNKLRNDIVSALTSTQVEQMVIQSNQQNPIEIVSYLVGKKAENGGLLTRIERYGQKALALQAENNKEENLDKKADEKRSETQMNPPVRINQFASPNHSRQLQDESLESSHKNLQRIANSGKAQHYYQSTIEQYKEYDRKQFEALDTLNTSKHTQQFGSQPASALEKIELPNDISNRQSATRDPQKLLKTPKSSNNKSFKIQHVLNGNNMTTKTFRRQVTSCENETKSNIIAKNIYNTTTDISIADEDPNRTKIDSLNQNRFSFVQSKAVNQVNQNSRSHTYEEPTLYKEKRPLNQKIKQATVQKQNIVYTISNGQQKHMSNVESNKSLNYTKNSQFELPKQITQSPMHQMKNVHHQYTENKQRTLDASIIGMGLPHDITSEQYILKNQLLNPSNSCSKQLLSRKTTASVDKTLAEQAFSEHGRNYAAKSYQDMEEEMRQRVTPNSIQLNPLLSASPLILPRIEMIGQNYNSNGPKVSDGRLESSIYPSVQQNQIVLLAGGTGMQSQTMQRGSKNSGSRGNTISGMNQIATGNTVTFQNESVSVLSKQSTTVQSLQKGQKSTHINAVVFQKLDKQN